MGRTKADPANFIVPVSRMGVSGGTAAFYKLKLAEVAARKFGSADYFIGKDLSHALDEVDFYEEARAVVGEEPNGNLASLISFMVEYAGILTAKEAGAEAQAKPIDMLVLHNLQDGCKEVRLLDMKIGQKTSMANWKGKSRYRSLRQDVIDCFTNSLEEGFRAEGLDGVPPALRSMNPLPKLSEEQRGKAWKGAFRAMLQQLRCADILMHFLDVHQLPKDLDKAELEKFVSPMELTEIVLREVVLRLALLAYYCRKSPTPHMWIGSSVALCFDYGELPRRTSDEEILEEANVRVRIFDWGRSELTTPEKHEGFTDQQMHDYERFWGYYIDGIDRLSWEAARCYKHRFGNASGWRDLVITLVDFENSGADNEVIGSVRLALTAESGSPKPKSALLRDEYGAVIMSRRYHGQPSKLTYSIEWRDYPAGSKFRGAWRITILQAVNLPRARQKGPPDAFAELVAVSDRQMSGRDVATNLAQTFCTPVLGVGSLLSFRQVTSVRPRSTDPDWQEVFELPVVRENDVLERVLSEVSPVISQDRMDLMFPPEEVALHIQAKVQGIPTEHERCSFINLGKAMDDETGIEEWKARLDLSAGVPARPRLPPGESLRMVHQANFAIRTIGILSCLASLVCAVLGIAYVVPAGSSLREDVNIVLICLALVLISPIPPLYECIPKKVQLFGCERCQDLFMDYGRCHKLLHRGTLYLLMAGIWLYISSLGRIWPCSIMIGSFLGLVGLAEVAAHCGCLRHHHARKVRRRRGAWRRGACAGDPRRDARLRPISSPAASFSPRQSYVSPAAAAHNSRAAAKRAATMDLMSNPMAVPLASDCELGDIELSSQRPTSSTTRPSLHQPPLPAEKRSEL